MKERFEKVEISMMTRVINDKKCIKEISYESLEVDRRSVNFSLKFSRKRGNFFYIIKSLWKMNLYNKTYNKTVIFDQYYS